MLDAQLVLALRAIARAGGLRDFVPISSHDVGQIVGASQQTANRRILELLHGGLLERRVTLGTKLSYRVTSQGADVLRREHDEYAAIFAAKEALQVSSAGRGQRRRAADVQLDGVRVERLPSILRQMREGRATRERVRVSPPPSSRKRRIKMNDPEDWTRAARDPRDDKYG